MAYNPYPTANIPNGWQIAGQGLKDVSKDLGEYQDRQEKLRQQIQEMADKKAKAILEAQTAADAHAKADREAAREKVRLDYLAKMNKDKPVPTPPPTSSAPPTATPAPMPGSSTQTMDPALSRAVDNSANSIDVKAGDDPTSLMGDALNAMPQDYTVPWSDDERLDEAFKAGIITPVQWAAAKKVKAAKDKAVDPFNRPDLLNDYLTQSQDPRFKAIAEGYAVHPEKYGPILQAWAQQKGYSGQKWWDSELGRMYHSTPSAATAPNQMSDEDAAYWQKQYADGKVSPEFISALFGTRGGNKQGMVKKIVQGAQAINPDVNPAKDAADNKFAADKKNRIMLATIDNVASRMGRLQQLSSSVDRTQFPTFNKWVQSGDRAAGSANATLLQLNELLTGEELTPIFSQGQGGSNAKLELATTIAKVGDLPVDVAIGKIAEVAGALKTRKSTYTKQMGRYAPKDDEDTDTTGAAPKIIPGTATRKAIDPATVKAYLKAANGDRMLAKKNLARDGYNIAGKAQ